MHSCIKLLRPSQWIKNLLLFAPLFFSGHIRLSSFVMVVFGIISFCMASSLGYILNDWIDKKKDVNHPEKKNRPFADGSITLREGFLIWTGLLFLLLFMLFVFPFPHGFTLCLVCYLLLSVSYSLYFRDVILLDIFVISFGFVIRVLAGGVVAEVEVSKWLFMSIFFLSMLISIAKRKSEILVLKEDAGHYRKNLIRYRSEDLSKMLWVMAGVSLVVYALYCLEKKNNLIYSIIPATYGIIRFCILAEQGRASDPVELFLKDLQLIIVSGLFIIFVGIKIYTA